MWKPRSESDVKSALAKIATRQGDVPDPTHTEKAYNVSYQFTVKNGSHPSEASASYLIGENGKLTINNTTIYSVALPSTGGPGTRLFTILGSILIAEAGALLVMRRKKYMI